jgi:diketogulonate reductase-like aldo/keto reductase
VNSWWFDAPWRPYLLHWDDRANWPDPWQLLEEKQYCGLARGLGILYTISLMERSDIEHAELIDTGTDNLVLVNQKKYILNWDRDQLLNISLVPTQIRRSISQEQIKKLIK